ncbi:hypothetical protein [Psychroserpens algicola]|uniref:Uncharacterized protein n=1 Tax=Psychroserpens algicola TaxID=1719034 RepID=A0ABT0HC93_9FLAO|nr:hypothetical protein [Psychroserpens algicola]MCK8481967.1 hypothetical protein [Psychroserpens algicola]
MRNLVIVVFLLSLACTTQNDTNLIEAESNDISQQRMGCANDCFSASITNSPSYFETDIEFDNLQISTGNILISWDYSNGISFDFSNGCITQVLVEFNSEAGVTTWDPSNTGQGYPSEADHYFAVDITTEFLSSSQGNTNIYVFDHINGFQTGTPGLGGVYEARILVNSTCGLFGCCQATDWVITCFCTLI